MKAEERIVQLATEKYGLKINPVEFDIIPAQKMLEIMAYRLPTNISNWKYGRDYERLLTIFNNIDPGLPYEVVINGDTPRAYLMNTNPFAVQVLVIAHVYMHENFYLESEWYKANRGDMMNIAHEARQRFQKYERRYGKDFVEMMVDAGHALQMHSSPFDNETEDEKRERLYRQIRLKNRPVDSEYSDITGGITQHEADEDIALKNQKILRQLKLRTPIEPTEDLLRYIIDNSRILEDWQKDILEFTRQEGRYFWPFMKTRYLNEGHATFWHEKICHDLFLEGYLSQEEHGQYNYSNALVKATHRGQMNPYLIGSEMFKNIEMRWDKGRYGSDYENCMDAEEKENWDTGDMKGREKIDSVVRSYTDWFFMQDFLTPELVDEMDLYIFKFQETMSTVDVVRTRHTAKQIRDLIIRSFSHSLIPKIEVRNGNYKGKGSMYLQHKHTGVDLDTRYAVETMKHIYNLWGETIFLETKVGNEHSVLEVREKTVKKPIKRKPSGVKTAKDVWSTFGVKHDGFEELIIDEIE
jgi:stage V sporulation protein R